MTDFEPQHAPFTGRKMLFIIFAFFGVIIAVNGTMLTLAVKTFGGLVVGNSYVASQSFNEDVSAAKAQPIRGWTLNLTSADENLILAVQDNDGAPIRNLSPTLEIARPTHNRATVLVPLIETADGNYFGKVSLEAGQWDATLRLPDGQVRSLTFTRKTIP